MKHFGTLLTIAALILAGRSGLAEDKDEAAKTKEVKAKDLTLTVPESWEQERAGNLRLAQFVLPKAEGDEVKTELVISSFGGGGGSFEQNLGRWLGEFDPEGRKVKITTGKSEQGEYILADITGTHIGSSFARRKTPLEDARLLAMRFHLKGKDVYYLKMAGPKKTVTAAAEALRASVGAKSKDEKEYKAEER